MLETDIFILGAGPGGVATALKLSYLGIPCIIADKAVFPRDKVCGDAISGKVTTLLNRLDPEILARFHASPFHVDVWGIRFLAPNESMLDIPFKSQQGRSVQNAPGYVCRRMDFDNFLVEELKQRTDVQFFEDTAVTQYNRQDDHWILSNEDGSFQVKAKLLIVADGAYSRFARQIAGLEKDNAHYAAAVRAYYSNVKDLSSEGFIELHFIKSIIPGYFWVFPLPKGGANVGLGMRSDIVAKKKVNLKESLAEIIENHPKIAPRFKEANLEGKIIGYGLPLGSKRRVISGEGYMLVGDAGHLVDPMTGEGIGNAFYSGFIAAEQAQACLREKDFSAAFLQAYDVRVARVLGSEMKLSYRLQKFISFPWVANAMGYIISRNQKTIKVLSHMYTDFSLREQLAKPLFWLKMYLGLDRKPNSK
ncbi:MAG: geranylgeranyl reductase family protein [Saprospiraceae bacterium]|nr:geranylgeranyl reductase family protein [Saprospiraceae bacterium]